MRLIVTGGGTGGHVYPALEVARAARSQGWDVAYFGSLRGQEGGASERAGLPFTGFASGPVYSLKTPRGWKALLALLKASQRAKEALRAAKPDVILSTGGYASAPVLNAARRLGIPYVVHEQNTVPGRTNRIMATQASAVCTVFEQSAEFFPKEKVVRTGMPVRAEMRAGAQGRLFEAGLEHPAPTVLVVGGSQGSAALNDAALSCAVRMARSEVQWVHVTGPAHYETTMSSRAKLGVKSEYAVHPYLQTEEMAGALFSCALCLCRSGAGTMAELAAFRKPSILVPFPAAFGDHQRFNALEFERIGAADVVAQSDLSPVALEARVLAWLNDEARREQAGKALAGWDIPDASERVLSELAKAVRG